MTHQIETFFLIMTLFIPRITLLAYFMMKNIPFNTIPFAGDVILTVFVPRLLVLIYIYQNLDGINNGWFWLHLVVAIIVWTKGSSETVSRTKITSHELNNK